jgi:hypothetical protein
VAKTRRAPDEDVRRRRPDDEDDDAPRRDRREDDDEDLERDDEPFKPRKRRESASGPIRLITRICFGVALATCIIILLIWVYSPVGTDHALLCYMPPETTSLTGYDVEEGSKNHKVKDVHDALINNYKQFGDRGRFGNSGVSDKDVAKYLSGVASAKEDEKDLHPQDRRGSITVIRFKKDVDQAKFVDSFSGAFRVEERSSKEGKKYHHVYRFVKVPPDFHDERDDDISFFFPNSRTLVYTSTWRECEEALKRQPGRVVVEGDMRELADKVDGHYFQASTGWFESGVVTNAMAFGLGFMDQEVRDQKTYAGRTGTASWWADNGNDFLYASAMLYSDIKTARIVRRKVGASIDKAIGDIWRSDSGKPAGLEDPFNPKQPPQPGGAPGGFGGGGGGTNEQTKDIIEALAEYAYNARVYNRGRLVIVEGTIPHGPPETGTFEKFWKAVGGKFQGQNQGMFGPPGMMGPGMGPMGPGMGMPVGPGIPPVGPGR